jgi:hypothetical protein
MSRPAILLIYGTSLVVGSIISPPTGERLKNAIHTRLVLPVQSVNVTLKRGIALLDGLLPKHEFL